MSFDGVLTRHVVNELNTNILNGKINKVYQLSTYDFLFQIRANSKNSQLLLAISPRNMRIQFTDFKYDKPQYPPNFCMFLRKHIEGGVIKEISQIENDRVIKISILATNELSDKELKHLYIELLGKHSNLVITTKDDLILDSLKHSSPFDATDRTIFPGVKYTTPTNNKINPYDNNDTIKEAMKKYDETSNFFVNTFSGVSPILSKEITFQMNKHNINAFDAFTKTVNRIPSPLIIHSSKLFYYCFDLESIEGEKQHFDSFSNMFDTYFYNIDTYERVKQQSLDIDKLIRAKLSKQKNKLEKLSKDLSKSFKREIQKIKGELILSNIYNIKKGDKTLKCINYYDNNEIIIDIDPLLSPNENSQKYFKKYKKLRNSEIHINEQIEITKNDIEYFELLNIQIKSADLDDIIEIREELIKNHYLRNRNKVNKKNKLPSYTKYIIEDNIEICVGKNNIQNEYITHKLGKKSETWFHVKNAPGSHVLVRSNEKLSELTIRTAAKLAAYYSKLKGSSSIPVDYTLIKYIKKIPGKKNCFVTYTNQKTIYIDVTDEDILQLNK